MALHIIKLSVWIDDIDHLKAVQTVRRQQARGAGLGDKLWHQTRNTPRRSAELLDGGSIYWVIKGAIRVRQRFRNFETLTGEEQRRRCRFILDPKLIPTEQWPRRPFQGWRYLEGDDAPADLLPRSGEDGMPPELVAELRDLGLW